MGKFKPLLDDTHFLAGRRIEGSQFHFISVTDMDDACGKDNEGRPRYLVELCEVDLDAIPSTTIEAAKKCCGLTPPFNRQENPSDLAIAEACLQYGAKAILFSQDTNSRVRGIRAASKESYILQKDIDKHTTAMNRVVNQLGSTAREFMQGDLDSATIRGIVAKNSKAELCAKMAGVPEEARKELQASTLKSAQICIVRLNHPELKELSDGDPIAYWAGFSDGNVGSSIPPGRDKLAGAYIKGYKHGVEVRTGAKPKPDWVT